MGIVIGNILTCIACRSDSLRMSIWSISAYHGGGIQITRYSDATCGNGLVEGEQQAQGQRLRYKDDRYM